MRAVKKEPSRTDRSQACKRLAHPVLLRERRDRAVLQSCDRASCLRFLGTSEIHHYFPQGVRLVGLVDGDRERIKCGVLLDLRDKRICGIEWLGGNGEKKARFGHAGRLE